MIEKNEQNLALLEHSLTIKLMETDADLRRDFKVIDEKMIDLPA
jgi:hypothetical protein